jgi:NTP pyrophosphatase (non-canonical NTP hydrolase)
MKYTFKIYGQEVEKLIITEPKNRLIENVLGIGEEAGEVVGKIKKLIRDGSFSKKEVLYELGDLLYYTTATANALGSNIQEVADMNMAKLKDRKKRNVIQGSGDNR